MDYCFETTNNFKNIYFDTSALAYDRVIKASGGIEKIKEILAKTIKRRSNSVIFGTDWPMGSIKKHINLVDSLKISEKHKNKIFSENTKEIYRI